VKDASHMDGGSKVGEPNHMSGISQTQTTARLMEISRTLNARPLRGSIHGAEERGSKRLAS
jgi:hypothetical protein